MSRFPKKIKTMSVALGVFTGLTSVVYAQAVIVDDQVVAGRGADVILVPEQAGDGLLKSRASIIDERIGLNIQFGFARVDMEAHEYVFDGSNYYGKGRDSKVSELIWKSDNVVMFGGKATFEVLPRINFHGEAWVALDDTSKMDDYDWLAAGRTDWTHWSTHNDTRLESGSILDIALGFSAIKTRGFTLDLLAGYKRDDWEWKAYGGEYIYSSDPETDEGFRDLKGVFPSGELGITYRQQYNVPYLGVAADVNVGRLNLKGKAIGSHWVDASHDDTHHLRGILFNDDLHNSKMYMLEGEASFALTQRYAVGAGYSYTKYDLGRGTTTANETTYYGDSGGGDLEYSKITVFVNGKF